MAKLKAASANNAAEGGINRRTSVKDRMKLLRGSINHGSGDKGKGALWGNAFKAPVASTTPMQAILRGSPASERRLSLARAGRRRVVWCV